MTTPAAVLAGAPVEAFDGGFIHDYNLMTIVFEEIMVSGAADIIPFLRWVPAMFSSWKRQAPVVRKAVLKAYDTLMRVAKTDHGGSIRGLIPTLLSQSVDPETEPDLRMSETEIKIMMGGLLYVLSTFMTVFIVQDFNVASDLVLTSPNPTIEMQASPRPSQLSKQSLSP